MDDPEIHRLIGAPKYITDPPQKEWKEELAHRRRDFGLEAASGETFQVFIRQNQQFRENFSVGLTLEARNGADSMILLRCNGPHGDFNRAKHPSHPHYHSHIHIATQAAILAGQRAESFASRTSEFATVTEAIRYFLTRVNVDIADQYKYFEAEIMTSLFDKLEEADDHS